MEISLKQKMIVTTIMGLIFAGSMIVKQELKPNPSQLDADKNAELKNTFMEVDEEKVISEIEESILIVDVEGAVSSPGIVKLPEGSRVYEALEQAGGILENADTKYINQAEELVDGTIIYVPFIEDNVDYRTIPQEKPPPQKNAININTADVQTLKELPGIGESYALAIVTYREENGFFKSVDELKNVNGIGEKKFEQLKDLVSVY